MGAFCFETGFESVFILHESILINQNRIIFLLVYKCPKKYRIKFKCKNIFYVFFCKIFEDQC